MTGGFLHKHLGPLGGLEVIYTSWGGLGWLEVFYTSTVFLGYFGDLGSLEVFYTSLLGAATSGGWRFSTQAWSSPRVNGGFLHKLGWSPRATGGFLHKRLGVNSGGWRFSTQAWSWPPCVSTRVGGPPTGEEYHDGRLRSRKRALGQVWMFPRRARPLRERNITTTGCDLGGGSSDSIKKGGSAAPESQTPTPLRPHSPQGLGISWGFPGRLLGGS